MMLVAAPFLLGAGISLLFSRAWQRVVFSGAASAALYAAVLSSMQAGLLRRGAPPGTTLAEPAAVAAQAALVVAPIGMCTGLVFHLITRYLRKNTA